MPVPAATVPDLVLSVARERPDAVAVRQWDRTLSYAELASAAGELAGRLRAAGVHPGARVAVCAGRTPDAVAAMLGVLASGAAYLPLDPGQPPARLRQLCRDAEVAAVVAGAGQTPIFDGLPLFGLPGPDPAPPVSFARAELPAYVLYTSGTSGRPKAVVVGHRAVAALVAGTVHDLGLRASDRCVAYASFVFDVSVLDLWVPLSVGAEVALVGDADRIDPARLQAFLAGHRVTWGSLPPAVLPLLNPDELGDLRTVLTGDEAPGPEQVARWSAGGRRFVNCYGSTETTVQVTAFEAAGRWDTAVPIGRPLANHRVHVVDAALHPVPAGTPGELLVGGPGLADGYLNDPRLTARRFLPDPFSGVPGERLYRTGDLVVCRDGELVHLGRLDRQVKVRGQRVELAEVEAVLRAHPGVTHAVVAAVPGTEVSLAAFLTPVGAPDDAELRAHLAARLPAVMVPARFLRLGELPLTTSGKVDVAALVSGVAGEIVAVKEIPGVPGELVAVWSDVLGVPARSAADDFFAAGGHSLTAMRLVAALRKDLRRDVAVEDVFAARTLGGLAARVAAAAELSDVDDGELSTGHPPALSAAQHRLWFLDQLAPDAAAYNIALAQRLSGPLDVAALRAALTEVTARHDVLRWRVPHEDGHPYAILDPVTEVPLPLDDLTELSTSDQSAAVRDRLHAEAATRFELADGGLLRARLLRLGPEDHVLAVTAHHAVFDGWSERILYEELGSAYAGKVQPPLPAGFADYVAWRAERSARRGTDDLAWWSEHLAGAPMVLDLPRDHPRPAEQSYAGAFADLDLRPATDAAVRSLAVELGATSSTVVLAAFAELLRRVAGRDEVVIGSPVADRRHVAFADLIGFFVDIVPLRLRGASTFAELVTGCRDELFDALAHPDAPLERIVDALALPRDPSRGALVQVMFNVYNFAQAPLELPGIRVEPLTAGVAGSPFDLTTYLVERAGRLCLEVVYNPDLYAAQRIHALLAALAALLDAAVAQPHHPVQVPDLEALRSGLVGELAAVEPVGADEPPAVPTERVVAAAWCTVLRRDSVGVTQNFFDLGGRSLDLVSLAKLLPGDPRVVDLFRYPTVRTFAAFLDGADGGVVDDDLERDAARRGRDRRRAAARRRAGAHRTSGGS